MTLCLCEMNLFEILLIMYTTANYLSKTFHSAPGKRVFDLFVEGTFIRNFDIFVVGGGKGKAFILSIPKLVDDGIVNIEGINKINVAKIAGIEIVIKSVHTAHAVTGGPVSTFSAKAMTLYMFF